MSLRRLPAMIRAADGSYLLYSTDQYLQIRRSTDRIHFTKIGSVWPNGAPWTAPLPIRPSRSTGTTPLRRWAPATRRSSSLRLVVDGDQDDPARPGHRQEKHDRHGAAQHRPAHRQRLRRPGHVAVVHDSDATPLTGKLGINLIGYDSAGWPYVH